MLCDSNEKLAVRDTASPKLWMDAYLAAFALAGGYCMVTTDSACKQFRGLDLVLLGKPVARAVFRQPMPNAFERHRHRVAGNGVSPKARAYPLSARILYILNERVRMGFSEGRRELEQAWRPVRRGGHGVRGPGWVGWSGCGALVSIVAYTNRRSGAAEKIRIISARRASRKETEAYAGGATH